MSQLKLPKLFKNKWIILLAVAGIFIIILIIVGGRPALQNPNNNPSNRGINIGQPTVADSNSNSRAVYSPTPIPNMSAEENKKLTDAIAAQQKADNEYANWERSVKADYPWRKKLPLVGEGYYVYFDLDKRVFIAMLHPKIGQDSENMKADILTQLKVQKGIPIDNYKFEWNITTR